MGTLHCYFCGGKTCKYESYENWVDLQNSHNAIEGLYSNWITDDILATARPSTRIIKQFGIIEQFRTNNIGAIINLQQPGEHQHCGDGISINSGFSYHPEEFMNENIFYYNFGWKDLTVPGFDLALNVVQVISYTLSQGKKVAIHCHAGLGRTGLIIACYLVFSESHTAKKAIEQVRMHRNMSIQTSRQAGFIWKFEEALKQLRVVYTTLPTSPILLTTVLRRQRKYLHGEESRLLRYVPKIVHVLCERLCTLLGEGGICELRELSLEEVARVGLLKESVNNDSWALLGQEKCEVVLMDMLIDWLSLLKQPFFSKESISFVTSFSPPPALDSGPPVPTPPIQIPASSPVPSSESPRFDSSGTPPLSLADSIESTIAALSIAIDQPLLTPKQPPSPQQQQTPANEFVHTSLSAPFLQLLYEPTHSTMLCILKMTHTICLSETYHAKLAAVLLPGIPISLSTLFLQLL